MPHENLAASDRQRPRDPAEGRLKGRSPELVQRRAEFAANARPATSSIYDWTAGIGASPLQLKAFDGAITQLHDAIAVGNHEVWGDPLPDRLQKRATRDEARAKDGPDAHAVAAAGVAGSGGPLPYGETVQRAFGHHDVSGVQAHVGARAREASAALGAEAYATGNHVAFGGAPSLFTVAHEAAHVVQQRAGVSLSNGRGAAGDRYERHADEVAAAVVGGRSAEAILDRMAGGGAREDEALQCIDISFHAGPLKYGSKGLEVGHPIFKAPAVPIPVPPITGLWVTPGFEVKLVQSLDWPKGIEPWKYNARGVEAAGDMTLSYGIPNAIDVYNQSQLAATGTTTITGRGSTIEAFEALSIALKTALNLGVGIGPERLLKVELNLVEAEILKISVAKIENGTFTGVDIAWGKDARVVFDTLWEIAKWSALGPTIELLSSIPNPISVVLDGVEAFHQCIELVEHSLSPLGEAAQAGAQSLADAQNEADEPMKWAFGFADAFLLEQGEPRLETRAGRDAYRRIAGSYYEVLSPAVARAESGRGTRHDLESIRDCVNGPLAAVASASDIEQLRTCLEDSKGAFTGDLAAASLPDLLWHLEAFELVKFRRWPAEHATRVSTSARHARIAARGDTDAPEPEPPPDE